MDRDELKPCPCCGSRNLVPPPTHWPDGVVYCRDCSLRAISPSAWNTRLQPSGDGEPLAFLKSWWNEGKPCTRVDLTEICEPWLDALKPTITPLYASPPPAKAIEDALGEILAAQIVQPYRGWNITKLNKAADRARKLLGLPTVRELNPDITALQDHAAENATAIRALAGKDEA